MDPVTIITGIMTLISFAEGMMGAGTGAQKKAVVTQGLVQGLGIAQLASKGGMANSLTKIVPLVLTPDPMTGKDMIDSLAGLMFPPEKPATVDINAIIAKYMTAPAAATT